jgi:hypothetical protein
MTNQGNLRLHISHLIFGLINCILLSGFSFNIMTINWQPSKYLTHHRNAQHSYSVSLRKVWWKWKILSSIGLKPLWLTWWFVMYFFSFWRRISVASWHVASRSCMIDFCSRALAVTASSFWTRRSRSSCSHKPHNIYCSEVWHIFQTKHLMCTVQDGSVKVSHYCCFFGKPDVLILARRMVTIKDVFL